MYRAKDRPFSPNNLAWNITLPNTFWHAQHTFTPELSLISRNITLCPGGSCWPGAPDAPGSYKVNYSS